MNTIARLLLTILCAAAILAPTMAQAEPSTVYLVRHGEKVINVPNPDLTEAGRIRARNIATILQKTGITGIYSSNTRRTMQTGQEIAARLALDVQPYDPVAPKALVAQVKAQHGAVLIVGHSDTLPELVRLLGGDPGTDIGEHEYDRLYQLVAAPNGKISTILLTSLPATPNSR